MLCTLEVKPQVSQTEHSSVTKCREEFARLGVTGEIIKTDDSARTAQEAAAALGVEVGQIVKSLLFQADGSPLMVLTSGVNRVDTNKVAKALNLTKISKADADLVRSATGYAIGGVPPFGHLTKMRILIDPQLAQYEVLWAAAGHPYFVFSTNFDELVLHSGAIVHDVALTQ